MGRFSGIEVSVACSLLCALVAAVAATTLAAAGNEVSGTFTVNGKATKFSHAYTYWKPNLFDATKKDLFVLFSDAPLAPEALPKDDDGIGKIAALVRDGKIHALELHLSPTTKQLDSAENAAVYHIGLSPGRYGMSGMHVFDATTFSDTLLEGKARTDGPQESDGAKWSYDVTFKVHLAPSTTPAPRKRASGPGNSAPDLRYAAAGAWYFASPHARIA